jgi:guanosine-3',5'-bis(diphosphate) 3'-pyrophosphohydrolase
MQVDYYTYKAQDFKCIECSWQGKGEQLLNGDFSELHSIGDLNCPKCYHLIAFWQAPLIEDSTEKKKFHLKVYDNYHYMVESEAYNHGQYDSYEEAMIAAKAIVDEFFEHNWKQGLKPDYLIGQYCLYGEDPNILPNEHGKHESFSARTYANISAVKICFNLEYEQMETQALYQEAIKFATAKHLEKDQNVPGTELPYVVHLSNVAMEILIASSNTNRFNLGFAVQIALLHDTIEDTLTDFEELENKFGIEIAKAVSALSKNNELPKAQQMKDSLERIKKLQPEVWAIKLADRITNLQEPPFNWDNSKKIKYQQEARTILKELKAGNEFLANRLEAKIEEYGTYLNPNIND